MMTQDEVVNALSRQLERDATLGAMIRLYQIDHDLFFNLACIGVSESAKQWAKKLAELAHNIRVLVRHGYEIQDSGLSGCVKNWRDPTIYFSFIENYVVRAFFAELNSTSSSDVGGKDYIGELTSKAEVEFKIGKLKESVREQ